MFKLLVWGEEPAVIVSILSGFFKVAKVWFGWESTDLFSFKDQKCDDTEKPKKKTGHTHIEWNWADKP